MEVAVSIINRQKDAKEQEGNGLLIKLTNETQVCWGQELVALITYDILDPHHHHSSRYIYSS